MQSASGSMQSAIQSVARCSQPVSQWLDAVSQSVSGLMQWASQSVTQCSQPLSQWLDAVSQWLDAVSQSVSDSIQSASQSVARCSQPLSQWLDAVSQSVSGSMQSASQSVARCSQSAIQSVPLLDDNGRICKDMSSGVCQSLGMVYMYALLCWHPNNSLLSIVLTPYLDMILLTQGFCESVLKVRMPFNSDRPMPLTKP